MEIIYPRLTGHYVVSQLLLRSSDKIFLITHRNTHSLLEYFILNISSFDSLVERRTKQL